MTDVLTLAVSKGRILEDTLPLLAKSGISLLDDVKTSRKLIFETTDPSLRLVVIRAADVPTFVEYGAADAGIAGKDVLMEHNAEAGSSTLYEPLDLGIAQCKLMVAGKSAELLALPRPRVATKYVELARQHFAAKGRQADIVKLYGSMELAPLVGLADLIVDLVDTGNTLTANGLKPLEHMADISSRLIVNKAAAKMKHARVQELLEQFRTAL